MFTNELSDGIYLARRRGDGLRIGLLVMSGPYPAAFICASDGEAMKAARNIQRWPGWAKRPQQRGCKVLNLLDMRWHGNYVDVPAYLMTALFNPVDSAGQILPMAQQSDVALLCVEIDGDSSRGVFAGYRWDDRADVPLWVKEKSGKSANSTIANGSMKSDEKSHPLTAAA